MRSTSVRVNDVCYDCLALACQAPVIFFFLTDTSATLMMDVKVNGKRKHLKIEAVDRVYILRSSPLSDNFTRHIFS
jgi:hypothetical protein